MTLHRRILTNIAVATLLVLVAVPSRASGDGGMTPRQLAELRLMTSAEISPDGSRIAAVRVVPRALFDQDNGPSWTELHVIDVADGTNHPYVTGEVNVGAVTWVPDGSGISFIAKRNGDDHKALYVIPATGGEARRVAASGSDLLGYSWSPDAARVAFIAKPPMREDDEKLNEQGFNQKIYEEDWRPRAVWGSSMWVRS